MAKPTETCPLLKIHEIHVSSQWLGLLNCSFLEIHVGSQWLGLLNYPLLKIHEIHVSSQWLGLLNCSFLEIHKSPQAPQIHRSTEPGSPPGYVGYNEGGQLTQAGVVRPSDSPWRSNVVLVKKPTSANESRESLILVKKRDNCLIFLAIIAK